MAGGSRRAHNKSRNGCGQCKRRKIKVSQQTITPLPSLMLIDLKCNELAPRCSNCIKWQETCDFESMGYPIAKVNSAKQEATHKSHRKFSENRITESQRRSISSSPPFCTQGMENDTLGIQPSLQSLDLDRLELMHHFLTSTSSTLQQPGTSGQWWEKLGPSLALRHEFLMHAVLGISALHIVHLKRNLGSDKYLTRARVHHQTSLALFRKSISGITPDNCTAAVIQASYMLPSHDRIDGLVTVLMSFRSHWRLFAPVQKWIDVGTGPIGGIIHSEGDATQMHTTTQTMARDAGAEAAFEDLCHFNNIVFEDEEEGQVYHEAILHMQNSLQSSTTLPRLLWPINISDAFWSLLKEKRPMALIILAHGCALAKYGPYR